MKNIIIRYATKDDLENIINIENLSSKRWTFKSFSDELEIDFSYFLIAVENNTILGFIVAWYTIEQIEINNIATLPNYRKKGIATALINKIISETSDKKPKSIILEVREKNKIAKQFYNNLGFNKIGYRKNYYGDDSAILMKMEI